MSSARNFNKLSSIILGATLSLGICASSVNAQDKPLACIAKMQKKFSSSAGINANCSRKNDCTFLAASSGDNAARQSLGRLATEAEACIKAAGLRAVKEEKQDLGVTRTFNGEGEGQCAVLINAPSGMPPEGVRMLCKTE